MWARSWFEDDQVITQDMPLLGHADLFLVFLSQSKGATSNNNI